MKNLKMLRALALACAAVASLALFGPSASAAPPRTVDDLLFGNRSTCAGPDCADMRLAPLAVGTTWTVREAPPVASAAVGLCASAESDLIVTRFERVVLFPRARAFVSSVAERNPKPLRRLVVAVAMRFRR